MTSIFILLSNKNKKIDYCTFNVYYMKMFYTINMPWYLFSLDITNFDTSRIDPHMAHKILNCSPTRIPDNFSVLRQALEDGKIVPVDDVLVFTYRLSHYAFAASDDAFRLFNSKCRK
jgi:hypothetical protein